MKDFNIFGNIIIWNVKKHKKYSVDFEFRNIFSLNRLNRCQRACQFMFDALYIL